MHMNIFLKLSLVFLFSAKNVKIRTFSLQSQVTESKLRPTVLSFSSLSIPDKAKLLHLCETSHNVVLAYEILFCSCFPFVSQRTRKVDNSFPLSFSAENERVKRDFNKLLKNTQVFTIATNKAKKLLCLVPSLCLWFSQPFCRSFLFSGFLCEHKHVCCTMLPFPDFFSKNADASLIHKWKICNNLFSEKNKIQKLQHSKNSKPLF